ncbi:Gustatory receptor 5a for trehalose [Anthophora plagiata]
MSDYDSIVKTFGGIRPLNLPAMKYQNTLLINVRSPKSTSQFGKLDHLKSDIEGVEMSEPVVSPASVFNPKTDSLHASMRPIIMLAQCFSMFPVSGVNTPDASHLRFTWRSPKFIYCAISFLGSSTMTIFNIMRIITSGINSTRMTTFVFNGTNLIASFLFLKLAMQWPCLMATWEKLEKELSHRHKKVSKTSLAAKFKIVTMVVMIFALVEHSFSILHGYIKAKECAQFRGDPDIIGVYFQSQFPQIFSRIPYSLWKGIVVDIINILSTFSWNFVDLFLILISIALADQFRQLNSRLYSIRGKPYAWYHRENLLRLLLWIFIGEDYGCLFVRRLDSRRVLASCADPLQRFRKQLLHGSNEILVSSNNGQHLFDRHEILLSDKESRINCGRDHSHVRIGFGPVQCCPAKWRAE